MQRKKKQPTKPTRKRGNSITTTKPQHAKLVEKNLSKFQKKEKKSAEFETRKNKNEENSDPNSKNTNRQKKY